MYSAKKMRVPLLRFLRATRGRAVCLLLLTVVTACAERLAFAESFVVPPALGPADFPEDVIDAFSRNPLGGIISALKGDSRHHASRLQLSYYQMPGDTLDFDILLANYTKYEARFRVFLLVDYAQTHFGIGTDNYWSFVVEVPPPVEQRVAPKSLSEVLTTPISSRNPDTARLSESSPVVRERRILPITLEPLSPGAHDILLIAVPESVSKAGSRTAVSSSEPVAAIIRRVNVFVNSYDHTEFSIVRAGVGSAAENRAPTARLISDSATPKLRSTKDSPKVHAEPSYIELNNKSHDDAIFAVSVVTETVGGACAAVPPRFVSVLQRMRERVVDPVYSRCSGAGSLIVVTQEPFARLEQPHGVIVEKPLDVELLSRDLVDRI